MAVAFLAFFLECKLCVIGVLVRTVEKQSMVMEGKMLFHQECPSLY